MEKIAESRARPDPPGAKIKRKSGRGASGANLGKPGRHSQKAKAGRIPWVGGKTKCAGRAAPGRKDRTAGSEGREYDFWRGGGHTAR